MIKNIFGVILVLAVLGGGAYLLATTSSDYEVVFADEVTELETQLASLDAQVTAGTLTPAAAAVARTDIMAKLASIEANTTAAGKAKLTDAQKKQLNDGLDRLKRVLTKYQDTLVVVDNTARKASGTVIKRTDRSLQAVFLDTIAETETAIEEIAPEAEADASLETELDMIETEVSETIEEVIEEVEAEEATEEATEESVSEESAEGEETATTTEEQESDPSDDTAIDASLETEATTEIDPEQI